MLSNPVPSPRLQLSSRDGTAAPLAGEEWKCSPVPIDSHTAPSPCPASLSDGTSMLAKAFTAKLHSLRLSILMWRQGFTKLFRVVWTTLCCPQGLDPELVIWSQPFQCMGHAWLPALFLNAQWLHLSPCSWWGLLVGFLQTESVPAVLSACSYLSPAGHPLLSWPCSQS